MTLEVQAVIGHGTVVVAYCVDPDGREVAIAVDHRMAHDLRTALGVGQRPLVEAERWQVLHGLPRPLALR